MKHQRSPTWGTPDHEKSLAEIWGGIADDAPEKQVDPARKEYLRELITRKVLRIMKAAKEACHNALTREEAQKIEHKAFATQCVDVPPMNCWLNMR